MDQYGHVNTHQVTGPKGLVRLPGSGGGADIACLARRLLIIMNHEKRRLKQRVEFITSPGWGDYPGWREDQGLTFGGPAALITSLAVFRFPEGRAALHSLHPGVTLDQVRASTGWPVEDGPVAGVTSAPSEQEIAIIRKFDPQRFWTG